MAVSRNIAELSKTNPKEFQKILAKEWETRRRKIFEQMTNNSIAVLSGALLQYRNNDAEYPFRQNSNFYYLTGFCEPEAVLVLIKDNSGNQEYILFCRAKSKEEEIWTGERHGIEEATLLYGATRAFELTNLNTLMPDLLMNKEKIFYTLGQQPDFDKRMIEWVSAIKAEVRKGVHKPETWIDLISMIEECRVIKSPVEIELIREACRISSEAHIKLMQHCQDNPSPSWEYQLEGEFINTCFQQGARFMAYTPIVATGKNACTLHYIKNDACLKNNDLILVDAGCEFQYYAADITRTFPFSGQFTEDQRAIYDLVLRSQLEAIKIIKPGLPYNKIQETIIDILIQGLVQLKILQGSKNELIKTKAYRQFYMHSSGHWLGLDVHDGGQYKIKDDWRLLEAGMVLTVEPGLYIPETNNVDSRWWNIGVRIEDDILVTEQGFEVLTEKVPKLIHQIEHLMKSDRLKIDRLKIDGNKPLAQQRNSF